MNAANSHFYCICSIPTFLLLPCFLFFRRRNTMVGFINYEFIALATIHQCHPLWNLYRKSTWPVWIPKPAKSTKTRFPQWRIGIATWELRKFYKAFEWRCALIKIDDWSNRRKELHSNRDFVVPAAMWLSTGWPQTQVVFVVRRMLHLSALFFHAIS